MEAAGDMSMPSDTPATRFAMANPFVTSSPERSFGPLLNPIMQPGPKKMGVIDKVSHELRP